MTRLSRDDPPAATLSNCGPGSGCAMGAFADPRARLQPRTQNGSICAPQLLSASEPLAAQLGGYTRGYTRASHTAQCAGPISSRISTALATTRLFNLGQGLGPLAPGRRMPRADIRRAGTTAPLLHVLASPARTGRDRRAPVVPLGEAPSDREQRRPPRPCCLIPCRPVFPVSLSHRAERCSYYTFYYSARHAKGPSPCRERALTCGN